MRLVVSLAALLLVAVASTPAAHAAEWSGIEPGVTTMEAFRARFGPPSKEAKQKVGNYDTVEWTYEGARSPEGFHKMVVEFGILLPTGYSPNTVRVFRLDPKRFIFIKDTIVAGWGEPDNATIENGRDIFFYRSGLVVTFDEQGVMVTSMFFTVKQPDPAPAGATPPGASPAPATPPPRPAAPDPAKPAPTPAPAAPPARR
jgi:hypothetical protein